MAAGKIEKGSTGAGATATSGREFVITRVFDAPRELVWTAHTESERLMHW